MSEEKASRASGLSRRDFHKLSAAAFTGVMLGAALQSRAADAKFDSALLLGEKHVCRGLNTCKGKAKDGKNSCAGTGNCATYDSHSCNGSNACKGQGGCGEHPGQNSCKGHGECSVPLEDKTWTKARKAFEKEMKKAGKTVGSAPKKIA
jgi:hypothetical protein